MKVYLSRTNLSLVAAANNFGDHNVNFYYCIMVSTYLPNPSTRGGYDTRSIFLSEVYRFEFRVFVLLD